MGFTDKYSSLGDMFLAAIGSKYAPSNSTDWSARDRYADIEKKNSRLARALRKDDSREERGMHSDERRTCWTHRSWERDCENERMHMRTGDRWSSTDRWGDRR